jgi:hypothetical protein
MNEIEFPAKSTTLVFTAVQAIQFVQLRPEKELQRWSQLATEQKGNRKLPKPPLPMSLKTAPEEKTRHPNSAKNTHSQTRRQTREGRARRGEERREREGRRKAEDEEEKARRR